MAKIRPLLAPDLDGVVAILNEVVVSSTTIFSDRLYTAESCGEWLQMRTAQGFPSVVAADENDQVVGFASFGEFRAGPGYRFTVEHTVYVRSDSRGQGIGESLVRALFPLATAAGKHVMVAGIDAANAGSVRFHERLGFVRVGYLREVGRKFERWLDLVFLEKML